MRELTALEIDQLDFSGRIPELTHREFRNPVKSSAKRPSPKFKFTRGKRRALVGAA
jgi:hypothetical protein